MARPEEEGDLLSQDDCFVLQQIFEQRAKDYPRLDADKYFEIFSAEQILKSLSYDLDQDQVASGIVGGGDDGGVDSFFLFANQKVIREDTDLVSFKEQQVDFQVVIIQPKNSASFAESALIKLHDFVDHCLRLSSDLTKASTTLYSQRLLDSVSSFHTLYQQSLLKRPTLKVSFYYASFGEEVHPKVVERGELLKQKALSCFTSASCDVQFPGASTLLKWFYDTPSSTVLLETAKSFHWGAHGKAYVCLVSLPKFAEFITNKGALRNSMFEANVRDYQGNVTVNTEIAKTLSSPGKEEFWWLNNGITVLASEIRVDGDNMVVTDPLIVNGLQTSHTIFNYSQVAAFQNDQRTVLVRLIEISDAASVDNIIKATNSQTSIPRIWLHATEEIHRKIETVLLTHGLYYDRRKNFHKNRGVAPSKIVTMPFLSQALAAIALQRPDDARARPTTVADRHYKRLFAEDCPKELYVKCALILQLAQEFLDTYVNMLRSDKLNYTFYLAMYATCCVLESATPKRKTIANVDLGKFTPELLAECLNDIRRLLEEEYNHEYFLDSVAKGPDLTVRLKRMLATRFSRQATQLQREADKY